jgi:hypothetical protein
MKKYLCHERLWIRFAGLYLSGLLIFFVAWLISYYFIPEGALKGSSLAGRLAGDDIAGSMGRELLRIFMVNLMMAGLIVGFNLAIRINRIPLGYLIPPIWFLLYGLILGSDSFSIAIGERMGPSLAVLQRSGLYELAAYTLITVSTFNISRFEIQALFQTNPERVAETTRFRPVQAVGLLIALLILLASNFREALMLIEGF